jgi:rhamnogalacturonyl hydrolase YesR
MSLQQFLEQLPSSHRARREYHDLLKRVAAEIHMIEVQRDGARAAAKGIVIDLIAEQSAEELKCWLNGPHQFKLAVIARLDNWR